MRTSGAAVAATDDGVTPSGQLERLGPNMFSRVHEPDADGQVYDIEILTQPLGFYIALYTPIQY